MKLKMRNVGVSLKALMNQTKDLTQTQMKELLQRPMRASKCCEINDIDECS